MTTYDFTGQVALVTGSTNGIGKATATTLARNGARVIITGRNADRGNAVVAEIRSEGGQADFIAADLHDGPTAKALAAQALELAGGRIDILVNNAGGGEFGPTAGYNEDTFDRTFGTNVKVPFFLVGELAPQMAARGKGVIVNTTTLAGKKGVPEMGVYGASKAALNLLTKSWAVEFGPKGVRVNAVSPGNTRTDSVAFMGDLLDRMAEGTPAGYVATPQQIADSIVYLASDVASFVHGAIFDVDGGATAL